MTAPDRTVDEALDVLFHAARVSPILKDALTTVSVEIEGLRGIVQDHPSWSDRREGMVVAYGYDGRYVGCVGQATWQWLIDHSEIGVRELDDLLAEIERLRAERDEASDALQRLAMDHYFARAEAAEARVRELESGLREIRNVLGPDHFSGELDGLIVEGEEALRIALALLGGGEKACQHPTLRFDRTVCACGWMHTYCADCGAQIDACQEGTAA